MASFEEALTVGKFEWQSMKDEWRVLKDSATNKDALNAKASHVVEESLHQACLERQKMQKIK